MDRIISTAETFPVGRDFILGGHAIFTLVGKSNRFTYRVDKVEKDGGRAVFFVKLLTGPDNLQDYTYMGQLDATNGFVRLTRASTFREDSLPVVAIRWALPQVFAGHQLPGGAQVLHEGRCGRCGRVLTVPASILSGFGPECATKIGMVA